ncbi:MAG: hypothetical protein LIO96_09875 [Lachnospiraceae bacterium]|nr:hypothetical protein [Lachnospiraceae bacterium]
MTLTDLQTELRSIEDHIARLHLEIEKMKPRTSNQRKTFYTEITEKARRWPFYGLSVSEAPDVAKHQFVYSLAYLIVTDGQESYERLLYLCRLAAGCGMDDTAQEIYQRGAEFDIEALDKFCEDLRNYQDSWLVEAFVIANLEDTISEQMLSLIAGLAEIMGYSGEELSVVGLVAKSRLTGNLDLLENIPYPEARCWSGAFADYISKEWLASQRKLIGTVNLLEWKEFSTTPQIMSTIQECMKTGKFVKCGMVLVAYEMQNNGDFFHPSTTTMEIMKAPCNGVALFMERQQDGKRPEEQDKFLDVYIVSYFDEY